METTKMNNEIIDYIKGKVGSPFKDFMSAVKRYDEQPSIPNGARKQEAREALHKALHETAEEILERWKLTSEELDKLLDEITMEV